MTHPHLSAEESASFDRNTIDYIQRASATGLYEIRGLGAKRKLPHFDDLLMLGASLSRYPLEGYREKCVTKTVLGTRFATKPIVLDIPITIAGMSFGALSANVKEALGRAATAVGTSTTTASPVVRLNFSVFRKNSFRAFLNRTSTISKEEEDGTSMFDSQSNTFILLQPPV